MGQLTHYIEEIEKQIEVSRMLLHDLPERITRMETLLLELKEHQSREEDLVSGNRSLTDNGRFSLDSTAKAA